MITKQTMAQFNYISYFLFTFIGFGIISHAFGFTYFTNTAIEPYLLYKFNRELQLFLLSLIFLSFYGWLYYKLRNKIVIFLKPLIMLVGLKWFLAVCFQLIIIFSTKDLFHPHLSTFHWNTSSSFMKFQMIYNVVEVLLIIAMAIYHAKVWLPKKLAKGIETQG